MERTCLLIRPTIASSRNPVELQAAALSLRCCIDGFQLYWGRFLLVFFLFWCLCLGVIVIIISFSFPLCPYCEINRERKMFMLKGERERECYRQDECEASSNRQAGRADGRQNRTQHSASVMGIESSSQAEKKQAAFTIAIAVPRSPPSLLSLLLLLLLRSVHRRLRHTATLRIKGRCCHHPSHRANQTLLLHYIWFVIQVTMETLTTLIDQLFGALPLQAVAKNRRQLVKAFWAGRQARCSSSVKCPCIFLYNTYMPAAL